MIKRSLRNALYLAGAFLGKGQCVRATRFVLNTLLLDYPNDRIGNGESMLVDHVFRAHENLKPLVVFDCGANIGDYSSILSAVSAAFPDIRLTVHCFEPCASTYTELAKRTATLGITDLSLHRIALSNQILENASLYVNSETGGTNTLVRVPEQLPRCKERVAVSTVDSFCKAKRIDFVDLLKIDTEGNDFNVILGAENMLRKRRIGVLQFEYNYRWVYAGRFLRDVFTFVEPFDYAVGKVTPKGVEFYSKWHPELEKFVEGNYVVCSQTVKSIFPAVTWWGDLINIPAAKA